MQFEAAVVFPADAVTVFEMMSDEDYVSRKALAMGALEHDVNVRLLDNGGAVITLERTLPSRIPDYARSLVGETIEVAQTEDWGAPAANGARQGRLRAEVTHAPVKLAGRLTLEPNGPRSSIHRVEVDIRARIPLLGSKIEKAIGDVLLRAARKEEEVGGAWLGERADSHDGT